MDTNDTIRYTCSNVGDDDILIIRPPIRGGKIILSPGDELLGVNNRSRLQFRHPQIIGKK